MSIMGLEIGDHVISHGDHIYLGRVVAIEPFGVVVDHLAWMASMGIAMADLLDHGIVEGTRIETPQNQALTMRLAWHGLIDWPHDLPTSSQPREEV